MTLLGITGGIGMGKSTAGRLLAARDVLVVDTDDLARELVRPGAEALREIGDFFGSAFIRADGGLDRARLADLVFRDAAAKARLEAILHPRIHAEWQERVRAWRRAGAAVGAVLIPLLFENSLGGEFAATVCVACSPGAQERRLLARGWTAEQMRLRLAAQLSGEEKQRRADFVVWTEGPVSVHGAQWDRVLAGL
jgi:dephospho-CoA kinase